MGDLNITMKRKVSQAQFNFKENEFSVNIPLSIFGKTSIPLQISEAINAWQENNGEEEVSENPKIKAKAKKEKKKTKDNEKLNPSAIVCLLASIGIAAITTGGGNNFSK